MTLTLIGPAAGSVTASTPRETRRTAGGPVLLALLRDMVGSSTDLDPDLLHSTMPAGRAVLTIAATARAHAAVLGADAGTPLTDGPGIVVMRDLVRALGLLEMTVRPGAVPQDLAAELPPELADAYLTFRRTAARAR